MPPEVMNSNACEHYSRLVETLSLNNGLVQLKDASISPPLHKLPLLVQTAISVSAFTNALFSSDCLAASLWMCTAPGLMYISELSELRI